MLVIYFRFSFQLFVLLLGTIGTFTNGQYTMPNLISTMRMRNDMEMRAGVGMDIGVSPDVGDLKTDAVYSELCLNYKKFNYFCSILNLIALLSNIIHSVFLAMKISY